MTKDIVKQRDDANIDMGGDFIDRVRDEIKHVEVGILVTALQELSVTIALIPLQPPLTKDMLTGQGIIFLTAGFETISAAIGHLVYNFATHPEEQEKAHDEVMMHCEDASNINHETIKEMSYLEACIAENMRMYPSMPRHDRTCTKTTVVKGNPDLMDQVGSGSLFCCICSI